MEKEQGTTSKSTPGQVHDTASDLTSHCILSIRRTRNIYHAGSYFCTTLAHTTSHTYVVQGNILSILLPDLCYELGAMKS